jgi:hypothetical protein
LDANTSNQLESTIPPPVQVFQGPTQRGIRDYSFNPPTGNRILNLELMVKWIGDNLVCGKCKNGCLALALETDIEGLSSSLKWRCSSCGVESLCPTSPKVKFLNIKSEKPKPTINLQTVGGTMSTGSTFKVLDGMLAMMDIPNMTHRTFDKNSKFFGEASVKLAVQVLEQNAKEEGEMAKKHGAKIDGKGRTPITVSFDGNWARRSYKHSYNSLLGGGFMFGFYTQKPIAYLQ